MQDIKMRYVRGNKSTARPRYVIGVHAESIREDVGDERKRIVHTFRVASAVSFRLRGDSLTDKQFHVMKSIEDWPKLLAKLTSHRHTTWVVSHDALTSFILLGNQDLIESVAITTTRPYLTRTKGSEDSDKKGCQPLIVVGQPPTILCLQYQKTQGRFTWVDIKNYFDLPIDKIAKSCSLPIPSIADRDGNDSDCERYCARIAHASAVAFSKAMAIVKGNDFGMFRHTAAGQSMAAFRHKYMKHKILIHDCQTAKSLERLCYAGGRVDPFRFGHFSEPIYKLDANSLYPSVMRGMMLPTKIIKHEHHNELTEFLPDLDWGCSAATVCLETDEPIYPVKYKGGVIYPIGKFICSLCGSELLDAAINRRIVAIGSYAEYECQELLTEFVNSLWSLRWQYYEQGDFIASTYVKLMMNALHGKFAQRSPQWERCPDRLDAIPWQSWVEPIYGTTASKEYRSFGYDVELKVGQGELDNTLVAISAWITAAARMRMNKIRNLAGEHTYYYQGVDSLLVNRTGYDNLSKHGLLDNREIGQMKLEKTADNCQVYGKNDYTIGDCRVVSGLYPSHTFSSENMATHSRLQVKETLFRKKQIRDLTEIALPWSRLNNGEFGPIGDDGWVSPLRLSVDWRSQPTNQPVLTHDG